MVHSDQTGDIESSHSFALRRYNLRAIHEEIASNIWQCKTMSGRISIRNVSARWSQAGTSKFADIYVSVFRSRRQKCSSRKDSEVAALNSLCFGRIGEDCILIRNAISRGLRSEDPNSTLERRCPLAKRSLFDGCGYLSGDQSDKCRLGWHYSYTFVGEQRLGDNFVVSTQSFKHLA